MKPRNNKEERPLAENFSHKGQGNAKSSGGEGGWAKKRGVPGSRATAKSRTGSGEWRVASGGTVECLIVTDRIIYSFAIRTASQHLRAAFDSFVPTNDLVSRIHQILQCPAIRAMCPLWRE